MDRRPARRRCSRPRFPTGALLSGTLLVLFASGLAIGAGALPSAVTWPPSTSLLISEIETGGASASDEFIELYNAGQDPVDLAGLELAYVTSSGGTVTRKVAWSVPASVDPGRHVLVANAAGIYAMGADATYAGGLSASGGSVVLRSVGGTPIDAVSWGDASNGYVEGAPAPMPAAGSSIERAPGGFAGNGRDTNDNAGDLHVCATPTPQRLTDPPVPAAPPSPDSTLAPSGSPNVEPTLPVPTPPASQPTPSPAATSSSSPTPAPTSGATPTPPPSPTPTPPPSSTPTPAPVVLTIAQARALPDGSAATIGGILTTPVGFVESGLEAFLEDGTAGIAIHLTTAWPSLAIGDGALARGTLDTRYGQRILRVSVSANLVAAPMPTLGAPLLVPTGAAVESWEGRQLTVAGVVGSVRTSLADGFGVEVDDGSGALRVVAVTTSGVVAADLPSGARVAVTGVLGQHDSAGGGAAGYRLYVRDRSDVVRLLDPSPTSSPTPSASPDPAPTPSAETSPSASPSPEISPSPSPSPTPTAPWDAPILIGSARRLPLGSSVTVEGAVTAESGAIVDLRTVAVQDATGGILVLLPAREAPILARGDRVTASGKLVSRSGALAVSVSAATVALVGAEVVPEPRSVASNDLGEAVEGLLVRGSGLVSRVTRAASGATTLVVTDPVGTFTVSCWRPCATDVERGVRLQVTGIAGQRWSRPGATDGYRIWPRDGADVVRTSAGDAPNGPVAGSTGDSGASSPPARAPVVTIAQARTRAHSTVTIEATVTTRPGFIDRDARRVVVQDASGGILLFLPASGPAATIGDRVRVTGQTGTLTRSPRFVATTATVLGHGAAPAPRVLSAAPTSADEWQLVRVSGHVLDVRRYGATWRAEIRLAGGAFVVIQGTASSGVPSTTLVEGRDATIAGIVRRPASGTSDQRLAVLPRSSADVALGPASGPAPSAASGGATSHAARDGNRAGGSAGRPAGAAGAGTATALDVDLAELDAHVGQLVRVGGLVSAVRIDGITLDDGTAVGDVRLEGDAASLLPGIEPGEPLNVAGTVERTTGGTAVVVAGDAAAIARVGRLGERVPLVGVSASVPPQSAAAGSAVGDGELRQVSELRLGVVALPLPGGLPGWALVLLAATLGLGAAAAVVGGRRWLAAQRERKGRGVVARLAELLSPPAARIEK